jgi:uncharacterized protein YbjT (DUF2867 family)
MPDTILVTGSTGNVGSQVVKQLSSFNGNVRAAIQSKNKANEIKNARAQLVEMNFNKPETISMALEGVEKLFLLTPFVPNMVDISMNLVNEAKKANVKHIVKQSAFGSDMEPPHITMNKLHRQVEEAIESSGINYTFLRPTSFMQNYLGFANFIKSQGLFYAPLADSRTSFVDIRDIAAVAVEALTKSGHENKAYNITGPEAVSNYDIANILSKITGRKVTYVNVSDDDARKGMKDNGMQEWTINALIELSNFQKAGKASLVTSEVERVTGRKPISFEQFAKDYSETFGSP